MHIGDPLLDLPSMKLLSPETKKSINFLAVSTVGHYKMFLLNKCSCHRAFTCTWEVSPWAVGERGEVGIGNAVNG